MPPDSRYDDEDHHHERRHRFKNKTPSCKEAFFGEKFKKWAFIFIIVVLAVLTIRDLVDLIVEYAGDPKQSDINMVFNDSMSMPNITFCMSKPQALSHFSYNDSDSTAAFDAIVDENLANMTDRDTFLKSPWDFHLVMEAYDMVATFNSVERETTAHGTARTIQVFGHLPRFAGKRATAKKWLNVIKERNVTFPEFTQKVGTEVLRRSLQRITRNTFNEDEVIRTGIKIAWVSTRELCYQPIWDKDNLKDINDQGRFLTLLLSHNSENVRELDCMSVDLHGRPASLTRFMEGKGRARDGFTQELCVGQRHEVTVEVRAVYSMLENDDNGTRCREVEEGGDDEFDCRSRCRLNMIRELCNCTAFSLSYLADDLDKYPLCDYPSCSIDVQNGNFSDTECADGCYRDCTQIRFDLHHETQGRMARTDLTLVNLNWGSFEYLRMEQERKYTVASFIAALGGAFGMWLGLSILSLIQGSTYLYSMAVRYIKNRKKGKVGDNEMDMHESKSKKSSVGANPFENPFVSDSPEPNGRNSGPPPSYRQQSPTTKIQVD